MRLGFKNWEATDTKSPSLLSCFVTMSRSYYCQFINNKYIIQSRSDNQESDAFARHNDAVIFNSANVQ